MKNIKSIVFLALVYFSCFTFINTVSAQNNDFILASEVVIEDEVLDSAVRSVLKIPNDRDITVSDMEKLRVLRSRDGGISSLEGLQYAKNLSSLDIATNEVSDLSPISGLTMISSLVISSNPVSDISPISNLINLKTLYIEKTRVTNFDALNGLGSLESIYANRNSRIDLSGISNSTSLKTLFIGYAPAIDTNSLAKNRSIKSLSLLNSKINNFDFLNEMEQVSSLILDNTDFKDVGKISKLVNLKTLTLEDNNLTSLDGIVYFPNLKEFIFGGNAIYDYSSLTNFQHLDYLYGRNMRYTSPEKNIVDGRLRINNPLKNHIGQSMEPIEISNNGVYDFQTNTISWENLEKIGEVSFKWSYGGYSQKVWLEGEYFIPYTTNKIEMGKILVKYEDKFGNSLQKDVTIEGEVGSKYITEKKEFTDFTLNKIIGEVSGEIEKNLKTIKYIYQKTDSIPGIVKVNYIDRDKNALIQKTTLTGNIGDKYEIFAKEIKNHVLVETKGQLKGEFSADEQEIFFIYETKITDGTTDETTDGTTDETTDGTTDETTD
ncbi:MucBP domain-containing protein, partial [Brochothrix thermosphacta]